MSDPSPDPYAVGGQLEDTGPATARPPSSPIPFLAALAVFAWVGPGQLWNPMIRDLLDKLGAPPRAFATFGLVMALTGLLFFVVVGTALGIAAIRALPASLVTTREGEPWDLPVGDTCSLRIRPEHRW
jgi:hypothetical protein